MSTAQALAFCGAKFIKKKAWVTGRVYIDHYDVRNARNTWCFIHPTDTPSPKPQPVFLYMLTGDDWEEIKDARDQQGPVQVHAGDGPRHEAEEENQPDRGQGQGVRGGPVDEGPAGPGQEKEMTNMERWAQQAADRITDA